MNDPRVPVIISVTITGSVSHKADDPALPVTPGKQVEAAHAAFGQGASLVRVAVRDADETLSSDRTLFRQLSEGALHRDGPGRRHDGRESHAGPGLAPRSVRPNAVTRFLER